MGQGCGCVGIVEAESHRESTGVIAMCAGFGSDVLYSFMTKWNRTGQTRGKGKMSRWTD